MPLEFGPGFCLGRVETVVNRVSRVFKENRPFNRERSSIAARQASELRCVA